MFGVRKTCREISKWWHEMQLENERLKAENAKLWEAVRHLRECTRHNVCAACKYAGGVCDFDYDLRELGIEVDE